MNIREAGPPGGNQDILALLLRRCHADLGSGSTTRRYQKSQGNVKDTRTPSASEENSESAVPSCCEQRTAALTCALSVMVSACWALRSHRTSVSSLSHGSWIPGPPTERQKEHISFGSCSLGGDALPSSDRHKQWLKSEKSFTDSNQIQSERSLSSLKTTTLPFSPLRGNSEAH